MAKAKVADEDEVKMGSYFSVRVDLLSRLQVLKQRQITKSFIVNEALEAYLDKNYPE